MTLYAESYVKLGRQLEAVDMNFQVLEAIEGEIQDGAAREHEQQFRDYLKETVKICEELGLVAARELISHAYDDPPETRREFDLLVRAVMAELKSSSFLFVPTHRARYHQAVLSSSLTSRLPDAAKELVSAADCFAAGLFTACVFHSMRAAEIGVRALGRSAGVLLPDKTIEPAEMRQLLTRVEAKIRGSLQDEQRNVYSEAALHFGNFEAACRLQAANTRDTYEEPEAQRALEHCIDFLMAVSRLLTEDAV